MSKRAIVSFLFSLARVGEPHIYTVIHGSRRKMGMEGLAGFVGSDLDRLSNVVTGTSHSRLIP